VIGDSDMRKINSSSKHVRHAATTLLSEHFVI